MIRKFSAIWLVTVLLLLLAGCEIQPPDKWPVIMDHDIIYNHDTTFSIGDFGPKFTTIDCTTVLTVDTRTYHASQDFKMTLILEQVIEQVTLVDLSLVPIGNDVAIISFGEKWIRDPILGTYLGGNPPQGIVQFEIEFCPEYVGLNRLTSVFDPDTGAHIGYRFTDQLDARYRVIVEDAGGRSDTFPLDLRSTTFLGES